VQEPAGRLRQCADRQGIAERVHVLDLGETYDAVPSSSKPPDPMERQ